MAEPALVAGSGTLKGESNAAVVGLLLTELEAEEEPAGQVLAGGERRDPVIVSLSPPLWAWGETLPSSRVEDALSGRGEGGTGSPTPSPVGPLLLPPPWGTRSPLLGQCPAPGHRNLNLGRVGPRPRTGCV